MQDNTLIFSMANSFSGHTLLSLLLNSHNSLSHLGDTISSKKNAKYRLSCFCGKTTNECHFWKRVYSWEKFESLRWNFPKNKLYKTVFYFPELFPIRWLLVKYKKELRDYIQLLIDFSTYVTNLTQKKYLIYGRKRIIDVRLAIASNIRTKIIHLSKSPYEFSVSCRRRKKDIPIENFARLWLRYNNYVYKCQKQNLNTEYLHIRFSELCKNPESELQKVCDYLNVGFDSKMLEPSLVDSHHIIGADSVVTKPFSEIKKNDSGKDLITTEEKIIIRRLTSSLAEKLGHSFD